MHSHTLNSLHFASCYSDIMLAQEGCKLDFKHADFGANMPETSLIIYSWMSGFGKGARIWHMLCLTLLTGEKGFDVLEHGNVQKMGWAHLIVWLRHLCVTYIGSSCWVDSAGFKKASQMYLYEYKYTNMMSCMLKQSKQPLNPGCLLIVKYQDDGKTAHLQMVCFEIPSSFQIRPAESLWGDKPLLSWIQL